MKHSNRISLKDWFLMLTLSAVMLAVIFLVMNGIQAVIIDTGRAIVH